MTKKFYYSISMNFETNSIIIGVDDSNFTMFFRTEKKVEPIIKPTNYGYKVTYKKLWEGINIVYELREDSIKESIIIQNNNFPSQIFIDIKTENCFIAQENDKYIIVDKDNTEIFSIPFPYVVNNKLNKHIDMKQFCNFEKDDSDSFFKYTFNKKIIKNFPIIVDPTFSFNTSYSRNYSYVRSVFDKYNTMLLTGATNFNNFISEELSSTNGKINTMSDDVIFESTISVIFPWVTEGSVSFNMSKGNKTIRISSKLIGSIGGVNSDIPFAYVDIEIPFSSPGNIEINCLLKTPSYNDLDFPISYKKPITYMPKIGIFSNDYITGSTNILSVKNLTIQQVSSFKPIEYSVIPYDLDASEQDYRDMGRTVSFKRTAKKVEAKSPYRLTTYFDIDDSTVPVPTTSIFTGDETSEGGGFCYSFANNLNAILRSAINNRVNTHESTDLKKKYIYISNRDITLYKRDRQISDTIVFIPSLKPFFYFIMKNEGTLQDYCDSNKMTITEMGEGIKDDHTTLDFIDVPVFSQKFNGSYRVEFDYSFGYGSGYTDETVIDENNPGIDIPYKSIDNNLLKQGVLVANKDGLLKTYRIFYSTQYKIVLKGRAASYLKDSTSFSIFFFNFDKITLISSTGKSLTQRFDLLKDYLDTENGSLIYNEISYSTGGTGENIVANLYDEYLGFIGEKNITNGEWNFWT